MHLRSKTAVITGSSRGIGSAIARRLARAGANVVVHGNSHGESAKTLVAEIRSMGVEATFCPADLSNQDEALRLVEQSWAWEKGVDIWVNNAGVDVLTGEAKDWTFSTKLDRLWQVDVLGTICCSRAVGDKMQQAAVGGAIVNIGWDQAWLGMEGDSGEMFATVKGAVMAFTKSLAKSLSPSVRVNCVAPGWIKTSWGDEATEYWQQRAIGESLRARWGTPEDIAETVCFLASPAADFINGQILPVNGGFRTATDRKQDG